MGRRSKFWRQYNWITKLQLNLNQQTFLNVTDHSLTDATNVNERCICHWVTSFSARCIVTIITTLCFRCYAYVTITTWQKSLAPHNSSAFCRWKCHQAPPTLDWWLNSTQTAKTLQFPVWRKQRLVNNRTHKQLNHKRRRWSQKNPHKNPRRRRRLFYLENRRRRAAARKAPAPIREDKLNRWNVILSARRGFTCRGAFAQVPVLMNGFPT